MLSCTTDYFRKTECPEPYLRRIAEAGFSHVHWCHQWNTDFVYAEPEIARIESWLDELGLKLLDLPRNIFAGLLNRLLLLGLLLDGHRLGNLRRLELGLARDDDQQHDQRPHGAYQHRKEGEERHLSGRLPVASVLCPDRSFHAAFGGVVGLSWTVSCFAAASGVSDSRALSR